MNEPVCTITVATAHTATVHRSFNYIHQVAPRYLIRFSFGPFDSPPKRHLNQISCFAGLAHATDTQTMLRKGVHGNNPHLAMLAVLVMHVNNNKMIKIITSLLVVAVAVMY